MKNKINENSKITLTIGQLKKLVKEAQGEIQGMKQEADRNSRKTETIVKFTDGDTSVLYVIKGNPSMKKLNIDWEHFTYSEDYQDYPSFDLYIEEFLDSLKYNGFPLEEEITLRT